MPEYKFNVEKGFVEDEYGETVYFIRYRPLGTESWQYCAYADQQERDWAFARITEHADEVERIL